MKSSKKPLVAAIGSAFVSSALLVGAARAETTNPFSMNELSQGYTLAMGDKPAEGKCGGKKKAGEGKCGGKKPAEGKCGDKKPAEGKCGGKKPAEGKCGGNK